MPRQAAIKAAGAARSSTYVLYCTYSTCTMLGGEMAPLLLRGEEKGGGVEGPLSQPMEK